MKISIVRDAITPSLLLKQRELQKIPLQAKDEFVKLTPKRTGNARSKTSLQNETIVANYDYARKLDKGYSKQAPQGMSKPLYQWLRRKFDFIIKRK